MEYETEKLKWFLEKPWVSRIEEDENLGRIIIISRWVEIEPNFDKYIHHGYFTMSVVEQCQMSNEQNYFGPYARVILDGRYVEAPPEDARIIKYVADGSLSGDAVIDAIRTITYKLFYGDDYFNEKAWVWKYFPNAMKEWKIRIEHHKLEKVKDVLDA